MALKTLDQFNGERRAAHEAQIEAMKPHANGIACPKCGGELFDSCPTYTLTSYPAQKNVHCPSCDYVGFRLA